MLAGSAAIRLRLLDVPLDRDEGEYAYIASLLLDGVPPYARAYNMKMPGIYAAYALVLAAFGRTTVGVHLGLLVITTLSTVLLFLVARRLHGAVVATCAATVFATLALNPRLLGLATYAEPFVLPAVLAGVLVSLRATESGRLTLFVVAGVLHGLAFVVKQSGGLFALVAVFHVVYEARARGVTARDLAARLVALAGGGLVPAAMVGVWLALAGSFANFWFWTVDYATAYGGLQTLPGAIFSFTSATGAFMPAAWPAVLLALAGVVVLVFGDAWRSVRALHLAWLVTACAAASLGFYFRSQYFLLMLPPVSMLAALGATAAADVLERDRAARRGVVATVLVLFTVGWAVASDRFIFFQATPAQVTRAIHDRNPFVEAVEVARYIRERSSKDDRIAVIGSEPEIYFYAGRPAATGYVYMYPLMESQPYAARMQQQLIRELTDARPRYLVFVNIHASWLSTPASDRTLVTWFDGYWRHFERVGIADIVSREVTKYRWDDAARGYTPESPLWVGVYRRLD